MTAFEQLAALLETTPQEMRERTLARAAEIAAGMGRFGPWFFDGHAEERFEDAARQVLDIFESEDMRDLWNAVTDGRWQERAFDHFIHLTGGPIRPTPRMWPQEKPFPIRDELCSALLQGYAASTKDIGSIEELFYEPGLAEGRWSLWYGHIHPRR